MSTRCQITIEDENGGIFPITVYKHSDGYPDGKHGVLAFLRPFVAEFFKFRGHDPSYFMAQVLRHWAAADLANGLTLGGLTRALPGDALRDSEAARYRAGEFLSWGVDTQIHSDLDYLYHVSKDGTIEVRRPFFTVSDSQSDWSAANMANLAPHVEFVWPIGANKPKKPRARKPKMVSRKPSSDLA